MPKYAQIIPETGFCLAISYLTEVVDASNMVLLADDEDVYPKDVYKDGKWTPAPPSEPVEPGDSLEDKVAGLQTENVNLMLALTELYEQKEADKAAMEQENINTMLALTELYEQVLTLQNGGAA